MRRIDGARNVNPKGRIPTSVHRTRRTALRSDPRTEEKPRGTRTFGRTRNGAGEQVTSLNSQVKGKGEQSDATPEPSAAGGVGGGGNGDPPKTFGAGAPEGSDNGDDDDEDDEDDDRRKGMNDKTSADKGRWNKRPTDNEGTEDENRFLRIMSSAIVETSKRPS